MARRFVISEEIEVGQEFKIAGDEAKHIMILRHNIGEKILVNDKICEIKDINKQEIKCLALEQAEESGVPDVKITLFQALLKSDKMEFVIQKAVEIGVSKIVPFISKNVVVKLDDKDKVKKVERWNKISVEASKQCGRSDIVPVMTVFGFAKMLDELKNYEKVIVAYENETNSLKKFLRENSRIKNVAIIIGAEGGFDEEEVKSIISNENSISVSLGERILRAETASLNLLSVLMYELE